MKHKTCLAVLPALACLAIPAASAPFPQIEDLGASRWGSSFAAFVSADGSVIGGVEYPTFTFPLPFVWTRFAGFLRLDVPGGASGTIGGLSNDGSVAVGGNGDASQVILWNTTTGTAQVAPFVGWGSPRLSGDGSTVMGITSGSGSPANRSLRWVPGTAPMDLGDLGGGVTHASAINNDGSLIVGSARTAAGQWLAFRWTAGTGIQPIDGLGADNVWARDVSADGAAMTGVHGPSSWFHRAYWWTPASGMVDLGTPPGSHTHYVYLSADGRVATGTYELAGNQFRSFRWTRAAGLVELAPTQSNYVTSISANGSVIVGIETNFSAGPQRAFRWTESGGIETLIGFGLAEDTAVAVSLDGTTIGGSSLPVAGLPRAVRWHDSGHIGGSYCDPASPNSTGSSGEISLSGSNNFSNSSLVLQARQLPPRTTGVFLYSWFPGATIQHPWKGLGLCLADPVQALTGPGQVQVVDANGEMSLTLDPTLVTGPAIAAFGQTYYFQAWHREPAGSGAQSSVTNGAYLTFY